MLEDDFNDVLGKAIRGLNIDLNRLKLKTEYVKSCLNGNFHRETIQELAPKLNLHTERLINLANYQPNVIIPNGVKIFTSPFGHLGVNAFTIENNTHILIFDTGTNAEECINHLSTFPKKEKHLFITHPHHDHVACELELLPHIRTNHQILAPSNSLQFGSLTLTSLDVAGHSIPASAYLIEGLESPICIVGDSIFAGSIGGIATESYQLALNNIKKNILTLPADTILLNGHGPATSVSLEKANNPFL